MSGKLSLLLLSLISSRLWAATAYFEPNRGQSHANAPFLARTPSGLAAIGPDRLRLRSSSGAVVEVTVDGASAKADGQAHNPIPGVSHYALDRDPKSWIYGVPHFGEVRFRGVYPGVDLRYHLAGSHVEFDFEAAKAKSLSRVRLGLSEDVQVSADGDLILSAGVIRHPIAWQDAGGQRRAIEAKFQAAGRRRVRLHLGPHDRSLPLTIDPMIDFATYLGGSNNEIDTQMTVDSGGNIYMAGTTLSTDFPASLLPGSPLNTPVFLREPDVYVTRLKPDASAIEWSFFIGGSASQRCGALLLDAVGDVYVFGATTSANFPVTNGAWRTNIDPSLTDEFAVKMDATTGVIKASTYLGLGGVGGATPLPTGGFAVDSAGGVYASGSADTSFQPTSGAYLTKTSGIAGLYGDFGIERLNPGLNGLVYATYIEIGVATYLQADPSGNLILAGSAGFVTPASPFPSINPIAGVSQNPTLSHQPFIAKLNAAGTALIYASLLTATGGSITDLQTDSQGNVWVTGYGASDLPQVKPLQQEPNATPPQPDSYTAFFAEIPPQGGTLLQSTVFNQPVASPASTIFLKVIRLSNRLCFAGIGVQTQTIGGLEPPSRLPQSSSDLSCVDDSGTKIGIHTFLPAANFTAAQPTPDGAILFAGWNYGDFPTTPGAVQPEFAGATSGTTPIGGGDAILMRVSLANPAPQIASVYPDSLFVGVGQSQTFAPAFTLTGSGFGYGTEVTWNNQAISSTFNSSSQIAITSLPLSSVVAGPNAIGASLPGPGGGVSAPVTVTGYNLAPGVLTISPSSVTAGASETKVVIYGAGFSAKSVLTWNGMVRAATYSSSLAVLELLLEPNELAQASVSLVTVTNPGPGGGTSPAAAFTVQPSSGAGVPQLTGPILVTFDESTPAPSILTLSGSGFAQTTTVSWDGSPVAATFVSATKIGITPPPGALSIIGAHDLIAANGPLASQPLRLLVMRDLSNPQGDTQVAFDPVHRVVYELEPEPMPNSPFDLSVFDGQTGKKIGGVTGLLVNPGMMAISDDGGYLYVAGGTSGLEIKRFNASTGAVDLDWQVQLPATFLYPHVAGMTTITGTPRSLAVVAADSSGVSPATQVIVYDDGIARPSELNLLVPNLQCCSAGFPFATSNRIYLSNTYPCLQWLDFDARGIAGNSGQCGLNAPDLEVLHGFAWLTDGKRVTTVSSPYGLAGYSSAITSWQIDQGRRLAYYLSPEGNSEGVIQVDLNTLAETIVATDIEPSYGLTLYLNADGSLTVVSPYWFGIPNPATESPNSRPAGLRRRQQ